MTIKYLDAKRIRGVLKTGKVGAKNWKSTTGNSGIQLGTTALATGDFTVGMWVKRNTTQTACIYATDDAGGASGKITLKWHDDTNYGMWATYDGTTHIKIGSLGGETGVWRHVALTGIDNSGTITLTLYINGAVATPSGSGGTSNPTTDSTTTRSDNTAKTIGNENTAGDGLIGELDEFFIYNRGLSTSEVLSIANGTKKPDDSSLNTSSSLKCYLPLDVDYNDASGLGNNGTESSAGNLDGNGALVAETEVDDKATLVTAASSGTAITQSTASAHSAIRTGDKEEFGMRCAAGSALNGITPSNITLTLKKVGSPTGNCYVKIYREASGSTETAVYTSPALDVSTITTSDVDYTFDLGSATEIDDDYKIIFNYVGGSSGNDIRIAYDPNNSYDGNDTGLTIRNTAGSGNFDTAHNNGYEMKFVLRYGVTSASTDLPENTIFEEIDTKKYYWLQDIEWKETYPLYLGFDGQRGIIAGGNSTFEIKYITIASAGNTTDFGDLSLDRGECGGCSNVTRACFGGGYGSGSARDTIDYVTVSTTGDATDFGDLPRNNEGSVGLGATDRGIFAGHVSSGDNIHYISIGSTGNATDFGSVTFGQGWKESSGTQDGTRGLIMGHYHDGTGSGTAGSNKAIDYLTILTTGSSADFGDLNVSCTGSASCSDGTYAVRCGGATYINNSNYAELDVMEKVTIQTLGNASDIGDLRQTVKQGFACNDSSTGRGVAGGGNSDEMDYFTIASHSGTASDFGNVNNTDRKQKATSGT